MNAIFFAIIALSLIYCVIFCPQNALPAMLNGANKSITLIFTLTSVYAVWMGVYNLLDKSGVTDILARFMQKPIEKFFKTKNKNTAKIISLNLCANLLGLGGVATPLGIASCANLEKENNLNSACLLVIISSSSIQLLPTSVISLLSSYGSLTAEKIILPCLICTIFSTTCGVFLHILTNKIKRVYKRK